MFLTALTWRIQPMKEKGKTRNIKAYEIIILTVLVIFAVIAFLKAFLYYAPAEYGDLKTVSDILSDLEYISCSRSIDGMTFYCGGIKYIYIFPDISVAQEQFCDFKEYIFSGADAPVTLKVVDGGDILAEIVYGQRVDRVAEIEYGDRCLPLEGYNAHNKGERIGSVITGMIFLIISALYFWLFPGKNIFFRKCRRRSRSAPDKADKGHR